MKFVSTNCKAEAVTFRQAVLTGLAPDGGLFVPAHIPLLSCSQMARFSSMPLSDIAFKILRPYLEDDFSNDEISDIIHHSFTFSLPLVQLEEQVWALELFHGPTLTFKDIGARFLAQVLRKFSDQTDRKIVILTATSGDTGGAVAHALKGLSGIEVVVLYPNGKVSPVQERQIAALGGNIRAMRVNGTFDDCKNW